MGLESSGASLLGIGVIDAGGVAKARFPNVDAGVFFAEVGSDGEGLGELVDFFWKKPRMDFWPFADCEAKGSCFFCEGRGVDISFPSRPRTITVIWGRNGAITMKLGRKDSSRVSLSILRGRNASRSAR